VTGTRLKMGLGGVAVVCCVHDREKRQVRTEAQIVGLGLEVGVVYDAAQHHIFECSCCENWFVDPGDVPLRCHACRGTIVHTPAAPLPEPTGRL
jgi:hypothetical protein